MEWERERNRTGTVVGTGTANESGTETVNGTGTVRERKKYCIFKS